MGLLSWLTGSECGSHHWGPWKDTDEVAVVPSGMSNGSAGTVKRKQVRYCEHECEEQEVRLHRAGSIQDMELLAQIGGLSDDRQKRLFDVISALHSRESDSVEHSLSKFLFPDTPMTWDFGVDVNPPDAYRWDQDE